MKMFVLLLSGLFYVSDLVSFCVVVGYDVHIHLQWYCTLIIIIIDRLTDRLID